MKTCQLCDRTVDELRRHHLVPKQKGGLRGDIINVCQTCIDMIHQLFSNKELAKKYNTLEKLKNAPKMKAYLDWVRNKPRERYTIARKKRK